jgi:hypothetical protein
MKYRTKILLALFSIISGICFGQNNPDSISLHIDLNGYQCFQTQDDYWLSCDLVYLSPLDITVANDIPW